MRLLTDNRVLDALIHVDPENDAIARPPVNLPARERIVAEVKAALAAGGAKAESVNLHYLSTGLDVEVVLPASDSRAAQRDAPALPASIWTRSGAVWVPASWRCDNGWTY